MQLLLREQTDSCYQKADLSNDAEKTLELENCFIVMAREVLFFMFEFGRLCLLGVAVFTHFTLRLSYYRCRNDNLIDRTVEICYSIEDTTYVRGVFMTLLIIMTVKYLR